MGRILFASFFFIASCSPDGGRPRRDTGPGGDSGTDSARPDTGGVDTGGADTATPDAERPDVDPLFDAGCDMTTPVPTQIVGDPPDMLLVVDISGSMCTPLGLIPTGDSKLKIMKEALIATTTAFDARINFGMMLFPASSGPCDPGTVTNPIAARNASPINSTLSGLVDDLFGCAFANSGATPTHTSLDAARAYYGTVPVNPIGRYVLLATDGVPNCGPELPDGSTEETVDETVAAIANIAADGIPTYVVGFGSGFAGDPSALARMATAGGTGTPFNASSAGELSAALDMISAAVIPPSCTVELEGAARDPMLFQVSFDGGPLIPRNEAHTSGWDYDPESNTITFYGADCMSVQTGAVTNIDVDFGCPGPLI